MKYCIINKKNFYDLFLYLALFFLVPISYIEEVCDKCSFIPLFRVGVCLVIIILLIRKRKLSFFLILSAFFCGFLVLSTFFNHGDYIGAIYGQFLFSISICCFFYYVYLQRGSNFLKILYNYYLFLIVINLITIIVFPNGLYMDARETQSTNFFMGHYNAFITKILPALCIGYHLLVETKISHKNYFFLWLLVFLTYLKLHSITSIFGIALYATFLCTFNKKACKIFLNPLIYVISAGTALYFVVFNRSSQIYELVTRFTGKDITFSGRTILWDKVLNSISKSIFIGFGVQTEDSLISYFELNYAGHSHNLALQVLFQTGILGSMFWLLIILCTAYNLWKNLNDKVARSYGCAFFSFLIMSIFDFYGYASILPFFLIINCYCNNRKKGNQGISINA